MINRAVVYPLAAAVLHGGGEHLVQFRTAEPIVAGPGDHFIVRSLSPIQTIGWDYSSKRAHAVSQGAVEQKAGP